MKFYFVSWIYLKNYNGSASVGGSKVLPYYGEFNLYKAHIALEQEANNQPVIILSWQEISSNQAEQYGYYVKDVMEKENKGKKPNLTVIIPFKSEEEPNL